MPKINLKKRHLLAIAALSVFSFVFVNGHAYCNFGRPFSQTELLAKQAAKEKDRELTLPDLTVLEKIIGFAQRFLP